MRVILEGCDGTGKTTLAKILAEKYNFDVCHCTQHDGKDYDFYFQTLRKENVIWDRHTLGELIYPEIFERDPQITLEEVADLMRYVKENNIKIFVLTADQETLRKRLLSRGTEDYRIIKNCKDIDYQFRHLAAYFSIPIIDTTEMTLTEIYDLITEER